MRDNTVALLHNIIFIIFLYLYFLVKRSQNAEDSVSKPQKFDKKTVWFRSNVSS